MTPLPPPLGSGTLTIWRIDDARYAADWSSGVGAQQAGGRWNNVGTPAVSCSLDPATAILEVAVHKGFRVLDTVPHVLTTAMFDPFLVQVIDPADVPEPAWLDPRRPLDDPPRAYGTALLGRTAAFCIPSTVSRHSWNVVLRGPARDGVTAVRQEPLVIDPRLHSAASTR